MTFYAFVFVVLAMVFGTANPAGAVVSLAVAGVLAWRETR